MDIPIDIAGRPLLTVSATSSSNFLTIPKANDLFVNEVGDQMRGDLDMNKSRIKNLGNTIDTKDATNKEYVDNMITVFDNKIKGELQILDVDLKKHRDKLKTLETGYTTTADRLKDVANKEYVDNMKRDLDLQMRTELRKLDEDSIKLRDRVNTLERNYTPIVERLDSLPYQHGSVLDIGISPGFYKNTDHTVEILKRDEWDDIDVNFQITPILDTNTYHDQIFINIRNYNIEKHPTTFKINLSVLSTRSTNEGWGLHIRAHLLITIFRKIFKTQKLISM